jgi:hypothetical protein
VYDTASFLLTVQGCAEGSTAIVVPGVMLQDKQRRPPGLHSEEYPESVNQPSKRAQVSMSLAAALELLFRQLDVLIPQRNATMTTRSPTFRIRSTPFVRAGPRSARGRAEADGMEQAAAGCCLGQAHRYRQGMPRKARRFMRCLTWNDQSSLSTRGAQYARTVSTCLHRTYSQCCAILQALCVCTWQTYRNVRGPLFEVG